MFVLKEEFSQSMRVCSHLVVLLGLIGLVDVRQDSFNEALDPSHIFTASWPLRFFTSSRSSEVGPFSRGRHPDAEP